MHSIRKVGRIRQLCKQQCFVCRRSSQLAKRVSERNRITNFEFLMKVMLVLNFKVEQRPRSSLSLNPLISIAVGIGAAILIGTCAIIIALRITCGRRNRRKDVHHNTTVRVASPGPSIKSGGSKDYDGNESDEKNPDVIPETIDSDDQVWQASFNSRLIEHQRLIHFLLLFLFSLVFCCRCYRLNSLGVDNTYQRSIQTAQVDYY